MDKDEHDISIEHGHTLQHLFNVYPTVRICRDLISAYVFERDVVVEGPKSETMRNELRDEWKKLKCDMLDHAMTIGFVAVHVKAGQVPTVVPWGLYRPTISIDKEFNTVLRAYPAREDDGDFDRPLKNVVVLDMFGYSPDLNGTLSSIMVPIALRIKTIVAQLDAVLTADRVKARPPIYTETTDDGTRPAEEVQYDYFADAESLERTSRNAYVRNKDALAELRAQQEMFSDYFGGNSDHRECQQGLESVTPLPLGQKISRAPEASGPEQLVERLRLFEQDCFSLMGVPRSFVMHDITVRHDAGMLHCSFMRTVHNWQMCMANALTYLLNVVKAPEVTKNKKRKRPTAPAYTVRFEQLPRVGIAELNHAYDRGVMSWASYQRSLGLFCGISHEDMRKDTEPWSKEERLMGWTGQKPKTEFRDDAGRS
tara:strand:+ start:2697 stop:3974 length:1278 start_codon:yes stop_codon:yes gene_type:complete